MSQAQPAPTQHVDNLVSKAFTKLSKKVNKLQNSVDNVNTGRVQTAIALTVSLGILAVSVAELVVVFWGRRRGFLSTDIKMAVSYVLILAFYLWLYGYIYIRACQQLSRDSRKPNVPIYLKLSRFTLVVFLIVFVVYIFAMFATAPYQEANYLTD